MALEVFFVALVCVLSNFESSFYMLIFEKFIEAW